MAKSITKEEKEYIREYVESGKNSPEIASLLGLKLRTVRKYVQKVKKGFASHLN